LAVRSLETWLQVGLRLVRPHCFVRLHCVRLLLLSRRPHVFNDKHANDPPQHIYSAISLGSLPLARESRCYRRPPLWPCGTLGHCRCGLAAHTARSNLVLRATRTHLSAVWHAGPRPFWSGGRQGQDARGTAEAPRTVRARRAVWGGRY